MWRAIVDSEGTGSAINHRGHRGHRGKAPLLAPRAREMGHPFYLFLCQGDSLADMAFRFLQGGGGLGSARSCGEHYYRDWGSIAGGSRAWLAAS